VAQLLQAKMIVTLPVKTNSKSRSKEGSW